MTDLTASSLSVNAAGSDEESYNTTAPSSVSTSTHDISRASYHIKELSIFAERVEQAAARAFPNRSKRGRSRYSDVIAVLIYWEEDDLNVKTEVDKLYDVFKDYYNFKTQIWTIPSTSAHRELMRMVVDFVGRYDSNDNLIIVYYGGHGLINNARQSTWLCNRKPSSPTVKWSAIQTVFEECACDVLFLLDCCAAAGAAPDSGQGVIETIAACGFETWAPGPGRHSFTNALVEVLDDWMDKPSFSAAMLHSEILSVIKHDRPERRKWTDANKVESRKTPIYILTSNDPKSKSIELSVRPLVEAGVSKSGKPKKSPTPNASTRNNIFDLSKLNSKLPSGKLDVPHVLLSVALEEDQSLDPDSWVNWMSDLPALAKYVLVEGVFRSHSTMILVSLPVPIWDVLRDDLAISFIGYVESRNSLVLATEAAPVKGLVSSLAETKGRVDIELSEETWQKRLENERKHAGEQYKALQEKYRREVEMKKGLEDALSASQKSLNRRTTNTQKMSRRPATATQGNIAVPPKPPARPSSFVLTDSTSKSAMLTPTLYNIPSKRTSGLPLPVRPSTPLRPAHERAPKYDDDIPSQATATTSSTAFSRGSAVSGWSSAGGNPNRRAGYGSESDISPPMSPVMEPPNEPKTTVVSQDKKVSWAQVAARAPERGKIGKT